MTLKIKKIPTCQQYVYKKITNAILFMGIFVCRKKGEQEFINYKCNLSLGSKFKKYPTAV